VQQRPRHLEVDEEQVRDVRRQIHGGRDSEPGDKDHCAVILE
jgi:hypothetical protein